MRAMCGPMEQVPGLCVLKSTPDQIQASIYDEHSV